ncbi:MAG: hypothetical protein ACR2ID_09265 [Chthoniobacterales bacterium]
MPALLRKTALFSLAAALICFCSCERHKPGELPPDEHTHSAAADGGEKAGHEHAGHDARPAPAAVTATPAATPAQFFPAASPAPSPR